LGSQEELLWKLVRSQRSFHEIDERRSKTSLESSAMRISVSESFHRLLDGMCRTNYNIAFWTVMIGNFDVVAIKLKVQRMRISVTF
jgi:hypothetical protein